MFDGEGLLARIGESPDDDLVRLVYADWLEENDSGDLAAFVRAQCAFARLPLSDKARGPLRTEIAALLPDVEFHWQRVLGDDVRLTRLSRGLPEAVMWKHWPEPSEMDDLLRRVPSIREIHPGYTPLTVTREMVTAAAGWLGRIEGLNLAGTHQPGSILQLCSRWAYLDEVRFLDVSSSLGNDVILPQSQEENFAPKLEELRLLNLPLTPGALVQMLHGCPETLDRVHFSIGHQSFPITGSTLEMLSRSRFVRFSEFRAVIVPVRLLEINLQGVQNQITHLNLKMAENLSLQSYQFYLPPSNRLHSILMPTRSMRADELESFFFEVTPLLALRELCLESTLIYPYDLQLILNSPVYPRLHELNLANNSLADEWVKDMLAVAPPEGLTLIDLRYNKIGKPMQAALADHFGPGICVFDK